MKKLAVLFSALALAAVGFAACGSDDETSTTAAATTSSTDTGGGGGTVSIAADPDGALAFTETEVSAPAGNDTVEFDNQSSTPHDVVIEDGDANEIARTDVISGDTATATADLAAGSYTFFCSVDGHRAAGMEGTLTVN